MVHVGRVAAKGIELTPECQDRGDDEESAREPTGGSAAPRGDGHERSPQNEAHQRREAVKHAIVRLERGDSSMALCEIDEKDRDSRGEEEEAPGPAA
jgi:hypothetical protein